MRGCARPLWPGRVLFCLLNSPVRGGDGARAVGAIDDDDDVGFAGTGPPRIRRRASAARQGVIDNDWQILQHLRWGARLRSRRAAPGAALNDQRNLAALTMLSILTRAREAGRRDAIGSARPARSAWSVQRQPAAGFDGEVAGGAVASSF